MLAWISGADSTRLKIFTIEPSQVIARCVQLLSVSGDGPAADIGAVVKTFAEGRLSAVLAKSA